MKPRTQQALRSEKALFIFFLPPLRTACTLHMFCSIKSLFIDPTASLFLKKLYRPHGGLRIRYLSTILVKDFHLFKIVEF